MIKLFFSFLNSFFNIYLFKYLSFFFSRKRSRKIWFYRDSFMVWEKGWEKKKKIKFCFLFLLSCFFFSFLPKFIFFFTQKFFFIFFSFFIHTFIYSIIHFFFFSKSIFSFHIVLFFFFENFRSFNSNDETMINYSFCFFSVVSNIICAFFFFKFQKNYKTLLRDHARWWAPVSLWLDSTGQVLSLSIVCRPHGKDGLGLWTGGHHLTWQRERHL